jgi:hypothetical protein
MPIATVLGEAAGNASHLAFVSDIPARDIDTDRLRDMQRRDGVRVSLKEDKQKR